jgi:hypothetical protein
MAIEERVAYDIGDRKYVVGKPKGQLNEKYNFFDACIITEEELLPGESLAKRLKQAYLDASERGARQVATSRLMSPQPIRFTIDIE